MVVSDQQPVDNGYDDGTILLYLIICYTGIQTSAIGCVPFVFLAPVYASVHRMFFYGVRCVSDATIHIHAYLYPVLKSCA